MDYKWIVFGSLILAFDDHLDWIVFGYQKDNKEEGLQMDSIWFSDICFEWATWLDSFWIPKG